MADFAMNIGIFHSCLMFLYVYQRVALMIGMICQVNTDVTLGFTMFHLMRCVRSKRHGLSKNFAKGQVEDNDIK